jgi:hypothetical protein
VEYDAIDRIEIIHGTTVALTRKPGSEDWIVSGNATVVPGSSVKVWFDQLQSLSATSFEPATPEHLAQRGLDQSSHPSRIRLIAHLSENTAEETAGERVLAEYALGTPANNEVALREGDATDLLILPESALDLVKGFGIKESGFRPSPIGLFQSPTSGSSVSFSFFIFHFSFILSASGFSPLS